MAVGTAQFEPVNQQLMLVAASMFSATLVFLVYWNYAAEHRTIYIVNGIVRTGVAKGRAKGEMASPLKSVGPSAQWAPPAKNVPEANGQQ